MTFDFFYSQVGFELLSSQGKRANMISSHSLLHQNEKIHQIIMQVDFFKFVTDIYIKGADQRTRQSSHHIYRNAATK